MDDLLLFHYSTNIATHVDLSAEVEEYKKCERVYQRKVTVKYVLLANMVKDKSTADALIVENTDNSTCLLKANPDLAPKSMFDATK